jgi:hypothetical protein
MTVMYTWQSALWASHCMMGIPEIRHCIIYTELQQVFVCVLLIVALRIHVTRQMCVYGWGVKWQTIWFYKKGKCSFYSHPTKINMIMKAQVVGMLHCTTWIAHGISNDCSVSSFRVWAPFLDFWTMKKKALWSFIMSVTSHPTVWSNIPEDLNLQWHLWDNLISQHVIMYF